MRTIYDYHDYHQGDFPISSLTMFQAIKGEKKQNMRMKELLLF